MPTDAFHQGHSHGSGQVRLAATLVTEQGFSPAGPDCPGLPWETGPLVPQHPVIACSILCRPTQSSKLCVMDTALSLSSFHGHLSIAAEDDKELVSPCLSPRFRGEWEHAEVTYRISGQKAGM